MAENWGTYVTVHAYTPRAIRQAIEAGVRCIEHGHLVDEPTVELMAERGIWWCPQPFLDDEDAVPLVECGLANLEQSGCDQGATEPRAVMDVACAMPALVPTTESGIAQRLRDQIVNSADSGERQHLGPACSICITGLGASHSKVRLVSVKPRLLQPSEFATAAPDPAEGRLDVPLSLIDPNPHNPRGNDLADIRALADNIRSFGLLQPVLVRRVGARFELLAGHRRMEAVRILHRSAPDEACWQTIPAEVRVEDDDRAYVAMLSAQLHTQVWTPGQEATALERLAAAGLTVSEIAALLHKTPAWASKRLRIYADPVLSSRVQNGQLAPGVAEELLPVRGLVQRQALAEQAVDEAWSQPVARAEVRRARDREQGHEVAHRLGALSDFLMRMRAQGLSHEEVRQLEKVRQRIDALLAETRGSR